MAVAMHQTNPRWNFGDTISKAIRQQREMQHQSNLAEKNREMQERISQGNQALKQRALDIEGSKLDMIQDQYFTRQRQEEIMSEAGGVEQSNIDKKRAYQKAIQDHIAKSQRDYDDSWASWVPFRGKMMGIPGFDPRDDAYFKKEAKQDIAEPDYVSPGTVIKQGDRITPQMYEHIRSKTPYSELSIDEMLQMFNSPNLMDLLGKE